ncbi:MAG: hypothetical protein AAB966_00060 [Patescibacteria group bacterium]
MSNKYILESLASDLKRVALGKHRGSDSMANRFLEEALKRRNEVEMNSLKPYLKKILGKLNENIDADEALMYGTLIQNYTQYSK